MLLKEFWIIYTLIISVNSYSQKNKEIIIPKTDFVTRKFAFDETIPKVAKAITESNKLYLDTLIDNWQFIYELQDNSWKSLNFMVDDYLERSIRFKNRTYEIKQGDYIIQSKLDKNGCLKYIKLFIESPVSDRLELELKITKRNNDLTVSEIPEYYKRHNFSPYKSFNEIENFLYLFLLYF